MKAEWRRAHGVEGWVLDLERNAGHGVTVHRHPAASGIWCVTCFAAGLDLHELEAAGGAAAREEALLFLDKLLSSRLLVVRRARGAKVGPAHADVDLGELEFRGLERG